MAPNKRLIQSQESSDSVLQLSTISMNKVMRPIGFADTRDKHTHIVCTMGPACSSVETVVQMIKSGMNVCRFNFSHGTHESHGKTLAIIKEALKHVPEANLGLMLDTKGPEIRTGYLKGHQPITLEAGSIVRITTDYSFEGTPECISCSYSKLPQAVSVGNLILIADGTLSCEVVSVGETEIKVKMLNTAKIGEYKNMNLPGVKVDLPVLTEKDKDFILNFGIPNKMHFIALSFTQNAQEIKYVRELLGEKGSHIKIIPKIENVEGLMNFDEILEAADGIMIARGDLGMEIPIEKVCLAQKMMIKKANMAGKPIITATQMLESMVNNPRPTRAESADVINAVLDGSDCVMLSGETAGGKFPVECVTLMSKLCFEAENCLSTRELLLQRTMSLPPPLSVEESVARAAVFVSIDIDAKLLIVFTHTGNTTRLVSKYRPKCLILSLSVDEHVTKSLTVNRSVIPLLIETFDNTEKNIKNALEVAKERDLVAAGDLAIAVHGTRENKSGSSDLLKVVKVQ
ncbi:pyruvate kinase, putative [Theileria equi strain WA]|uniref:Pyruvate kinase n=1 Tax=Theileria equi strain WA TaxID=1537102 RepID=L0B227_THEEQ|nr:pyruvate kinase, putative [Theileria equi strain WA]AFZ81301.1 pyruvate kinase, putative [Theileria equi strain WA]|eukprot:XP_004830967.1 pyruvate kinase, putative [Theileria equi strain WA]